MSAASQHPNVLYCNAFSIRNKIDEWRVLIDVMKPEVACVSESKLKIDIDHDDAFEASGFILYRDDRLHKDGGGVAVWVSENLQHRLIVFETIVKPVHIECVWIYFQKNKSALCCVYIPPNQSAATYSEIDDFFVRCADDIQTRYLNANISIIGDINRYVTRNIEAQLDLHKAVHFNTRGNAILDQILTCQTMRDTSTVSPVANLGKSDHAGLWWKFHETAQCKDSRLHKVYDFRRSNIDAFISLLDSFDLDLSGLALDKKVEYLTHALDAAFSVIPSQNVMLSSDDKCWISPKMKLFVIKRNEAYLKNAPEYDLYKGKVKTELEICKKRWVEKQLKNGKTMWNVTNLVSNKTKKINFNCLICEFDSLTDFVNEVNKQFASHYIQSTDIPNLDHLPTNDWQLVVDEHEVFKYLACFDIKKSTCNTDLPTFLYKEAATCLAGPLCEIVNHSINDYCVPDLWKIDDKIPIPKCRPIQIEQLRPITPPPLFGKMLEGFVLSSVGDGIALSIDKDQFAYKKLSSTTCMLVECMDFVGRKLDDPNTLAVALVTFDFSKAFDQVDHGLLLKKMCDVCLDTGNIPGDFIRWTASYLSGRKQRTIIMNEHSDILNVTSGVPQGSILGPCLFSLFTSDLRPISASCAMKKFADDTSIMNAIMKKSVEMDCNTLKSEIRNIFEWANLNKLKLNLTKCKVLFFRKNSPLNDILPIVLEGITVHNNITLLGVTLDPFLKFDDHIDNVIRKAAQRLYILRLMKTTGLPTEGIMTLYFTLIRSILEYAAPIMIGVSKGLKAKLELLQRRAHRIICDKDCRCTNLPLLSERTEMIGRRMLERMRMVSHPCNHLLPNIRHNRYILPTINTNRYRNTFVPAMIICAQNIVLV